MAHVPSRPKKDTVVRNHPFEFITYIYDSTICVHDCMIEEPRLKQMNSMHSLFVGTNGAELNTPLYVVSMHLGHDGEDGGIG